MIIEVAHDTKSVYFTMHYYFKIIILMFALSMGWNSYAQTEELISYRFYQDAAFAKLLSPTNKYDVSEFETIEVDCIILNKILL